MRNALVSLMFTAFFSVSIFAQTPSTGTATARGTCNIANTGNSNTHLVINCGIGQQQGKKMLDILNKILANQLDADAVMKKIDELLAKPTYQQNCTGSACAQGPGSQATFNQFGEPQRHLTATQKQTLASLKGIVGGLPVFCYSPDKEGCSFASEIRDALIDAGLDEEKMVGMYFGIPTDTKVYVAIKSKDEIPPAFERIIRILQLAGLQPNGLILADMKAGEMRINVGWNK